MNFLVTGSSGFIGYHVSKRLLDEGHRIIGLDNVNKYYNITLKLSRLNLLRKYDKFVFYKCDLSDAKAIKDVFSHENIDRVIHFGAQSGVRHSLKDPMSYITSNIIGYFNVLEECRIRNINHLIYASSSSVYGLNDKFPFSIADSVNFPTSLYGVSKRTNELMAHAYSHLYQLPTTGLRFFTVYGPWGRPDMALFKFTHAMLNNESIDLYNYGRMSRSFTFIDDVVEVVVRIQDKVPGIDYTFGTDYKIPCCIYNVAHDKSIDLLTCVQILERILGVTAKKKFLPMQLGDMVKTDSDTSMDLYTLINFRPETPLLHGIEKFVDWYYEYYQKY